MELLSDDISSARNVEEAPVSVRDNSGWNQLRADRTGVMENKRGGGMKLPLNILRLPELVSLIPPSASLASSRMHLDIRSGQQQHMLCTKQPATRLASHVS